ncbi:MAG: ABC-2 type transport system permease protein [Myxococcota bacterium]|jgi:ABC-2 type transport system permease protein
MNALVTLAAVLLKEVRQTLRDKRVMAVLIIAPVFQLIVLGYAVNLDVEQVPTAVADEDGSAASRALIAGLLAGDTFALVAETARAAEAIDMVSRGEASVAFIVPKGFAVDRAAGRKAYVQVLTDGSDSNRAIVAQNAAAAYVQRLALADVGARLEAASAARGAILYPSTVRVEPRVFYNPTLESPVFFVPGVAATLLLIVALVVTAMGLAREKEMGTLEQILVTPISPVTLIAGKTLPYAVVGLLDLALVLVVAMVLFDVPIRGSLLIIFVGGAFYLLSILGVGLFVSTIAKNQQQAFMSAIFFIMPAILLSGFITPVANMPEWLQPMTAVNPVRHFVELLRAVMLKDAGWVDVAPQLVALAGTGIALFAAASVAMGRRLS